MRNSNLRPSLAISLSLCCFAGSFGVAHAQSNTEDRLRAALRSVTAQLRSAQDQNSSLQATQAQAERERMALAEKLAADEKELASLRQQLGAKDTESKTAAARLQAQQENFLKVDAANKETFAKLQTAYNETAERLRTRDGDATRFDAALVQLRTRFQACETKNAELYRLGKEVLDVYDNRNIFATIGSTEPFTKLKRVEYENLMQDYEDKMRSNALAVPAR